MRETLELLEDLLGEAKLEFDNGDFVEIADDQARNILASAGITNMVAVDPKVKSYIENLGYRNNALSAAQAYAKDPVGFSVGQVQVKLPQFIPLENVLGQPLGPTCMTIAGLKRPEKGELGKGEVLFAMLTGGKMIEQAEGDTDVKVGNVEYSLKDFRGGSTKLGARDTESNAKNLKQALATILKEILRLRVAIQKTNIITSSISFSLITQYLHSRGYRQ